MVTQENPPQYLTMTEADRRFSELDRRLNHIEDQIADLRHGQRAINERIDTLNNSVNERFDTLHNSVNERFDKVNDRFDTLNHRMNERFDRMNERFEALNERILTTVAAAEERLRRENRWMFGIMFALLLAILGLVLARSG